MMWGPVYFRRISICRGSTWSTALLASHVLGCSEGPANEDSTQSPIPRDHAHKKVMTRHASTKTCSELIWNGIAGAAAGA